MAVIKSGFGFDMYTNTASMQHIGLLFVVAYTVEKGRQKLQEAMEDPAIVGTIGQAIYFSIKIQSESSLR